MSMSLVKSTPLGLSTSFSSTSSDASVVSTRKFRDEEQGLGGIESALAVVQAIAPLIPIPVVSSIVESAGMVVSAAKTVKQCRRESARLAKGVAELVKGVTLTIHGREALVDGDLQRGLAEMLGTLSEIKSYMQELNSMTFVQRVSSRAVVASRLSEYKTAVDRCMRDFTILSSIRLETKLEHVSQDLSLVKKRNEEERLWDGQFRLYRFGDIRLDTRINWDVCRIDDPEAQCYNAEVFGRGSRFVKVYGSSSPKYKMSLSTLKQLRHPQISQLEGYSPDDSMGFYVLKHDMIPVTEALRGLSPVSVAVEYVRMMSQLYSTLPYLLENDMGCRIPSWRSAMYDPSRKSLIIAYEHLIPYESYVAWYKGYTPDVIASSSLVTRDWNLRQRLLEDFSLARDSNMQLYERLRKLNIGENLRMCQPDSDQITKCEVQDQSVGSLLLETFVRGGIAYSVTQRIRLAPSVQVAVGSVGYFTEDGGFVILMRIPVECMREHEVRAPLFSSLTEEAISSPYECTETQTLFRFWEDRRLILWAEAIQFLIKEGSRLAKLSGGNVEKLIVVAGSRHTTCLDFKSTDGHDSPVYCLTCNADEPALKPWVYLSGDPTGPWNNDSWHRLQCEDDSVDRYQSTIVGVEACLSYRVDMQYVSLSLQSNTAPVKWVQERISQYQPTTISDEISSHPWDTFLQTIDSR